MNFLHKNSSLDIDSNKDSDRALCRKFAIPAWDDVAERYSKKTHQCGYRKGDPDPNAFARIPLTIAETIGYNRGSFARVHAQVLAGLVFFALQSKKASTIRYVGGGEAVVPEGVFVTSMQTVAENVFSSLTGSTDRSKIEDRHGTMLESFRPFYEKTRNAFDWLIRKGYVAKLGYVNDDDKKGTYWTFQKTPLESYISGDSCETVDVREKVKKVFLDLEADRFGMAEACTSKYKRGRYLKAHNWNAVVAKDGANGERHVSIGSFEKDVVTERTPCTVPYVVLEGEAGDITDRHDTTHRILKTLHADGVDLSDVIVAFSANKSFHIRIPAGMFGSRVFKTVDLARRTIARWSSEYVDEELDTGLFDPRHLIRMIGSRHEKTGRYVTGFPADEFMGLSLSEIVARSEAHTPFPIKEPFSVPVSETLATQFEDAADSLFRFYIPPWEEIDEHDCEGGGAVTRALEGVSEGETWHDRHTGRNKAAYVVACHLIKQGEGLDELLRWNEANDPPLSERELTHCFRSATRTIQKAHV